MIRSITIKIFLITTLLASTSCVTDFLWGARKYREEITQFYAGSDGRYVVLTGPQYHYVLTDSSGVLKEILSLRESGSLGIGENIRFDLDDNNNVEGELSISGSLDYMPQEDVIKLQILGFIPDKSNYLSTKIKLKGRRYSARFLQPVPQSLKNRYFITVYYRKDTGFAEGVGKAAITPVAMTLDAVLFIGKVAIYPLAMTYKKNGIE